MKTKLPEIADELYDWLGACINCKAFLWSPFQRDATEYSLKQYEKDKKLEENARQPDEGAV